MNAFENKVDKTKLPFFFIQGGAKLSYSSLAFANNGSILASVSGLPDFQLTIW